MPVNNEQSIDSSPLINIASPYESALYSNNLQIQNQTLENLLLNTSTNTANTLPNFNEFLIQQQILSNNLSPPYSNQQSSPQSNISLSPQNFIMNSPSPAKGRPSLPTSPTHIAAMRAATQQKHGGVPQVQNLPMGYDFSQISQPDLLQSQNYMATTTGQHHQQQQQIQQQSLLHQRFQLQQQQQQQLEHNNYQYLTPPSQHSMTSPDTHFLTPSPESPDHWSANSPHSCNSDWSQAIKSPMNPTNMTNNNNSYILSNPSVPNNDGIYI